MRQLILAVVLAVLFSAGSVAQQAQTASTLKVGDLAPDFALPYATKDTIVFAPPLKLSEEVGKQNIVLAFYPADWSGGCTKEMCTIRDDFSNLENLNAEILPISGDYVFTHEEWAKHHNLQFKMLSDHSHAVAKKYGSYNDLSGFNKRTVYVIDKTGKIAYMNLQYNVGTPDDFQKLKEVLASLK
ncbi:MAG: redoxin domain-containing protein [Bacteroidota bacterium]